MTEINNNKNISGYGLNREKISSKNFNIPEYELNKEKPTQNDITLKQDKDINYDTGVLGRSQIKNATDITKSVDEAVFLAENNPVLLNSSEYMFDTLYNHFIDKGMTEEDAYTSALLAEEEFLQIGLSN